MAQQQWLSLSTPTVDPEWAKLTIAELRAKLTDRDQSHRFLYVRAFRDAKDSEAARAVLRPLGLKQLKITAEFFKWRRGGNRTELIDRLVHHRERLIHLRQCSLDDLKAWTKEAQNQLLKAVGKGMGWGTKTQKAIVIYQWREASDLQYRLDTATAIHVDAIKAALDANLPVHTEGVQEFKIAQGMEARGYVQNPKTRLFEYRPGASIIVDGSPMPYGTWERKVREARERIAGHHRGYQSWQTSEQGYRKELEQGVDDERFEFIARALRICKESYARITGEIAKVEAELSKLLDAERFRLSV